MSTVLNFELPDFLARANARELVLPRDEDRMRFVLDLARENIAAGGGPFAAAVFEHGSGRLLAAGANRVVASGFSCAHAEIVALTLAQHLIGMVPPEALPREAIPLLAMLGDLQRQARP